MLPRLPQATTTTTTATTSPQRRQNAGIGRQLSSELSVIDSRRSLGIRTVPMSAQSSTRASRDLKVHRTAGCHICSSSKLQTKETKTLCHRIPDRHNELKTATHPHRLSTNAWCHTTWLEAASGNPAAAQARSLTPQTLRPKP